MSLKKRAVSGILWASSSSAVVAILNFAITAILARLLSPSDFGLMGLVLVVTGFAMMLGDLGLTASVIQKQDIDEDQLSTLFCLNMLTGIVLFSLCYAGSDAISVIFNEAELAGLLKTVSISFILVSFGQLMRSLLQKKIEFKALFIVDVISSAVYGIASIHLALQGYGVWSLVFGLIARQATDALMSWTLAAYRPRLRFSIYGIKDNIKFGAYVFGDRMLNYFNRNLDNILIGRFLGSEALGYYTLAYNLMLFPVFKIAGAVSQVAYPTFSLIQGDDSRIREGYLKMVKYISMLTFPIMAILFATAPEFVGLIYGAKWAPAVPVLQILCLVGATQSIGTTIGSVFYAKGRSDLGFKLNIFVVCYYAAAFGLGVRWGIVGVASLYAFAAVSSLPSEPYLLKKLIGLQYGSYFKSFLPQAVEALIIVAVILLVKQAMASPAAILGSAVLIGTFIACCFVYFTDKKAVAFVTNFLAGKK